MAHLLPRFDRMTFVYKTVNNVDIKADVLVSKSRPAEKTFCPLLVHFHGGGLFMGRMLEPQFLSEWLLKLVEERGAILVSAEYRLLPEANGADILEDVGDFWAWVGKTLPAALAAHKPLVHLNLEQVGVVGESAGGYLAVQSALLFPEAKIRVVMAQYCAMHTDIAVGRPDPSRPVRAPLDAYLATLAPGAVRTATPFPEMLDLCLHVLHSGAKSEVMGDDERLTLSYGLRTATTIPPMWVIQGMDDQIMPKEATDTMVARIRQARPDVPLLYSVRPGDHGFDATTQLSEPWMAEAMDFVQAYWP